MPDFIVSPSGVARSKHGSVGLRPEHLPGPVTLVLFPANHNRAPVAFRFNAPDSTDPRPPSTPAAMPVRRAA